MLATLSFPSNFQNGLFFFFLEFTEISKKVGIAWNNLSEEDKQVCLTQYFAVILKKAC